MKRARQVVPCLQLTDLVKVSAGDLKLGPLADNSGPTKTHALPLGSVAIDAIPEADCVDADGEPPTTASAGSHDRRPEGRCATWGAFELEQ